MNIFIATLSHESEGSRKLVYSEDNLHFAQQFAQEANVFLGSGYTVVEVKELEDTDIGDCVMELVTV